MAGMGMAVDEARQDRRAARINNRRCAPMLGGDLGAWAGRDDTIAVDRNGAILDDAARRVEGDQHPARDEEIGH